MGLRYSNKYKSLYQMKMPTTKSWCLTVRKASTSFAVSVPFPQGTNKDFKVLRSQLFFQTVTPFFIITTTAVSFRDNSIHILRPLSNSEKVQFTVKKAAKNHRRNSIPAAVYQESKMASNERQSLQWERTCRNNHCSFQVWLSLGYWPQLLHKLHC